MKIYSYNTIESKSNKPIVYRHNIYWQGKGKKRIEDGVECLECGKEYKALPTHLIFIHNMTIDQYKKKHGINVELYSKSSIKLIKKVAINNLQMFAYKSDKYKQNRIKFKDAREKAHERFFNLKNKCVVCKKIFTPEDILKQRKTNSLATKQFLNQKCCSKKCRSILSSISRVGRVLSEDHKKKIGLASKGRKLSDEVRKKMSLSQKGKKMSMEARKKISIAKYKYWNNKLKK